MSNIEFITLSGDVRKRLVSNTATVDFSSIKIGTSALEIKETSSNFDFGSKKIANVVNPTAAQDAATKAYVDSVAAGLNPKDSAQLATIAALPANLYSNGSSGVGATIIGEAVGALTVDGVAVVAGNRILVKNEPAKAEISTVDFDSKTPASLSNKYFQIDSTTVPYYVWFNLDAGGSDPSGSNPGRTAIEVAIATGDTASDMAGKTQVVLEAHSAFTASVLTNVVTITNSVAGPVTDIAAGDSALTVAVTKQGIAANVLNGIYVVVDAGGATAFSLIRATDFDGAPVNEVDGGEYVFVTKGGTLTNTGWVVSSPNTTATIGVTPITFVQFSAAGVVGAGAGLVWNGSDLDIVSADMSIIVGANDIAVKRLATGAIGIDATPITGGLKVNVDDTSIEIATNALRVKALGIATGMIAADAVDKTKINADVAGAGLGQNVDGSLEVTAGDSIKIVSDAVAVDYAKSLVNNNGGTVTIRQVVYIKANGEFALAKADVATLNDFELGLVEDATILDTASGKVVVKHGAIVGGFSGLTPGKLLYVSNATAGAYAQSLAGFLANEFVYSIGRAISATEVVFAPSFEYIY